MSYISGVPPISQEDLQMLMRGRFPDLHTTFETESVQEAAKSSAGEVFLPPGYETVKLVISFLEEKVKMSTSHRERELFRKTIHVLQCRGCKDREKHNKARCRRCEKRDKKKKEEQKENDLGKVDREKIFDDSEYEADS